MHTILFFFSDTGGGHRAAAEAIIAGLNDQFPGRYRTPMFDGFAQGSYWPVSTAPAWYRPVVTYAPRLWGLGFHQTNTPWGEPLLNRILEWTMSPGLAKAIAREKPDLLVTVHPLMAHTARRALDRLPAQTHPPLVTVVTDLFDTHRAWYRGEPVRCIVPTERARGHALASGLAPERVRVIGLPVSLKFAVPPMETQAEVRRRLGLVEDRTTVLLVGGGEGMGPLYEIARALASAQLPLQLVVIAGRHPALQKRLEQTAWEIPVKVTGFVTNMPDWMRAADLIVTKAGPGTIMEALACGLPVLLSGYLPGQEEGNARFVVESGVGQLVTEPEAIAAQVREWLAPGNDALARMAARAREAARPRAALEIAAALDEVVEEILNRRRVGSGL